MQYLRRLKLLQEDLHNKIQVSKLNYYSRMTMKSLLGIIKKLLKNKKITLIPPSFHGNEYVTDFKKKTF